MLRVDNKKSLIRKGIQSWKVASLGEITWRRFAKMTVEKKSTRDEGLS